MSARNEERESERVNTVLNKTYSSGYVIKSAGGNSSTESISPFTNSAPHLHTTLIRANSVPLFKSTFACKRTRHCNSWVLDEEAISNIESNLWGITNNSYKYFKKVITMYKYFLPFPFFKDKKNSVYSPVKLSMVYAWKCRIIQKS